MATVLKDRDMNSINIEDDIPTKKPAKNNKRLSVERIYQKKSQLEHIILRPDSYIGSTEPCQQNMWVWDDVTKSIVSKNITFSPGLYKIFDEILVNAADNKQRDPRMNTIKVNIDPEKNVISVWNNGRGIPIEMHKEQNVYVPTLIFGHLLTSSNYDDTDKKVVGGRNGYGAKLCNIFSTKFTVETVCEGKKFKQTWKNNMGKADTEKIVECSGTDFTSITFTPDLAKFKMEKLDDDFVALLKRRAYDMAGVCRGVNVCLNGEKLKVRTFKDYVGLYVKAAPTKNESDVAPEPPKIIHEIVNPRWEVCVTVSETGFQQSSFVNSIATTKGGTHINYLVDQICEKLIAAVKKKQGKGGFNVKPFQVKSHLWVFANTLIENPTFDSQTKENMTLRKSSFGSACELSDKYIKQVQECGVLENIMSWVRFKSEAQLNKKGSGSKHSRLKGVPKLEDANNAGTKNSRECTLIVTEGDSAKALVMAGLSVVGRDKYGVFPLRGKLLNVRDASHTQIMNNAEIGNLLKIIGLQFGKKYETEADLKSLRYGHLMIMADQDQDGSHIKGLVINFIHANWPDMLKLDFLEEFITPIIKVSKSKKETISFFSIPEFEEWKAETPNHKSWHIKYYKGLGSSTSIEGKEYFSDLQRHRIVFEYDGPSSDQALILAFSKKCANERKNWLDNGLEERRLRKEAGLPEMYLYERDTKSVTYQEFVNKELILFSNTDNERSIPSLVDGFKPGQRKVLYTCIKRNDKRDVKVAQLAGSVAELSAYHHGEMSLMGTIVNLAQNYVGSNNLNVLQPLGQFGTRHMGGKDHASPRYIFTMMSPLTRLVFPAKDDNVLSYLFEDNQKIEPEWYCPIIPMCLANGADGIGTGYSTKIPNFAIRDLVKNVRHIIAGEPTETMIPSYKDFSGEITAESHQKYSCSGVINILDETTIEISELPIRSWTQSYKESVLDPFLYGTDKVQACITDYKEYHTDTTVKFAISMTAEQLAAAEREGLHKKFKLTCAINLSCMVLFDRYGRLKKYENVDAILKEFYDVRMEKYTDRKKFMLGMLEAECAKLENQARFILEKIEGKIKIENRSKRDVVVTLVERGFVADPVKAWKAEVDKDGQLDDDEQTGATTDAASSTTSSNAGPDFAYLLSMQIMSLSKERKDELLRQRNEKRTELEEVRKQSPADLWMHDLAVFEEELERVEEEERQLNKAANELNQKNASRGNKMKRPAKKVAVKSEDITKAMKPKKENKEAVKKETEAKESNAKESNVKESKASSSKSSTQETDDFEEKKETEVLSLADRLKKNFGEKKAKKPMAFQAVGKKKKKVKLMSSSEEESEADISDFSGGDSDDDFKSNEPVPKSNRQTRKKEVEKYFTEPGDEDDDEDKDDESSSEKNTPSSSNSPTHTTTQETQESSRDNSEEAQTRALIAQLSPMKKEEAAPQKAGPSKLASKKLSMGSSEGEPIELDDDDEPPVKEQPKKKPAAKKKSASPKDDPKQTKINFGKATRKAPTKSNSVAKRASFSDSEDEVVQVTKKIQKAPAKSKDKEKRPLSDNEEFSPIAKKSKKKIDSDDEVAKKPLKKKAAPKKKATKRKPAVSDDEDSFRVDLDGESDQEVQAPPRARGGARSAATKKKVYKFSSDEDDDDDDFSP